LNITEFTDYYKDYLLQTNFILDMSYEYHIYNPLSQNDPMPSRKAHNMITNKIYLGSQIDMALKKIMFEDHQSWIIDEKDEAVYSQLTLKETFPLDNNAGFLKRGLYARFDFKIDDFYRFHKRTYMKLFECLGMIGGLFNLMFTFSFFLKKYSYINMENYLINTIFQRKEDPGTKLKSQSNRIAFQADTQIEEESKNNENLIVRNENKNKTGKEKETVTFMQYFKYHLNCFKKKKLRYQCNL